MRLHIRVRPGARRDAVGGVWGPDQHLLVTVQAPAVDGKANDAVEKVLARALGLTPRQVKIVSGVRSKTKRVEITSPSANVAVTIASLRGDAGGQLGNQNSDS